MSIRKDGKIIAGATQYHPNLFDWKWSDHKLNDMQWLRADTFSWQDGSVFAKAYQHLAADITGKTAQSETVDGVTISFYLADDGHKITTDESAVAQIYAATGVAWYYVIDTTNQRFKLPRTKHNKYADTLGVVGNGMTLGLWNGTEYGGLTKGIVDNSANLQVANNRYGYPVGSDRGSDLDRQVTYGITNESDKSGIIAQQTQDTEQYKYLYFYVGQFTQTALENTAGITAEALNDKVDKGHQVIEFQEPSSSNNYTWYRLYADGWVEQGGTRSYSNAEEIKTITLPITMSDSNYTLQLTRKDGSAANTNAAYEMHQYRSKSTTGFSFQWSTNNRQSGIDWQVSGIAA